MNCQYSVIIGFLGQLTDRLTTYHEPRRPEEKVALTITVEDVQAIVPSARIVLLLCE